MGMRDSRSQCRVLAHARSPLASLELQLLRFPKRVRAYGVAVIEERPWLKELEGKKNANFLSTVPRAIQAMVTVLALLEV